MEAGKGREAARVRAPRAPYSKEERILLRLVRGRSAILLAACLSLAAAGCATKKLKPDLSYQERPVELLYDTGAAFPTDTKDVRGHFVTPEGFRAITGAVSIPVVAIGGITKENLSQLAGCGLAGAAVVSALFAQPDVEAAARELLPLCEAL